MQHHWIKTISVPLLAVFLAACLDQQPKVTGIDATANPTTVTSGATSSLTATVSGTGAFNAGVNWSLVSGGGSLSANTGGSVTYTAPSVTATTTAQVKATAAGDSSVSKTLSITVQPTTTPPKPTINAFSATPSSLPAAGPTTLTWEVSNATSLSIDSGVGAVTGTSKVVDVASSTTFTLTATNASGSSTATVTVTVASQPPPPTVVSVSPADGETGVTKDANIVVTFSKPMNQVATQAAYQSTDLPTSGVTFEWDASGTQLTINPNADLTYLKTTNPDAAPKTYSFTLTNTATDLEGNKLTSTSSSFSTLKEVTSTLTSTDALAGMIYSSGTINDSNAQILVGDTSANLTIRGFVTFDISSLPAALTSNSILKATLRYTLSPIQGDPLADLATCTGGTFGICTHLILESVVYGGAFDPTDFDTPALRLVRQYRSTDVITPTIGVNTVDALTAVRDDQDNRTTRAARSQFRFRFSLQTNADDSSDYIALPRTGSEKPSLEVVYLFP